MSGGGVLLGGWLWCRWVAVVPVGGNGAEMLMHVDRLCRYG